jgi:hypothetical protein
MTVTIETEKEVLRHKLIEHPLVQRLLGNQNWKQAAEAAISYFIDGKRCKVHTWPKSSTWSQVEVAFEEVSGRSGA